MADKKKKNLNLNKVNGGAGVFGDAFDHLKGAFGTTFDHLKIDYKKEGPMYTAQYNDGDKIKTIPGFKDKSLIGKAKDWLSGK